MAVGGVSGRGWPAPPGRRAAWAGTPGARPGWAARARGCSPAHPGVLRQHLAPEGAGQPPLRRRRQAAPLGAALGHQQASQQAVAGMQIRRRRRRGGWRSRRRRPAGRRGRRPGPPPAAPRRSGPCVGGVQRIYVHRSVLDAFAVRLLARVRALRVGDPLDEATDLGPLIDTAAAERVEQWVTEAVAGGALRRLRRSAGGGERLPLRPAPPTGCPPPSGAHTPALPSMSAWRSGARTRAPDTPSERTGPGGRTGTTINYARRISLRADRNVPVW